MDKCLYCRKDLHVDKWNSEWTSEEHHYKSIKCECGKENWVKVDFYGSGHDSFFKKLSPLESAVRKVQEK